MLPRDGNFTAGLSAGPIPPPFAQHPVGPKWEGGPLSDGQGFSPLGDCAACLAQHPDEGEA
jgi:hypothetical protein